jgi:hypothetical protein
MTRANKLGIWAAAGLVVAVGTGMAVKSFGHDGHDGDGGGWGERQRFSNRSIKGAWGFNTYSGVMVPPAAPEPTPATGMGRAVFDGNGGCSVSTVTNFGGTIFRLQSSSCTYSVDANGFGRSEAVFPGAPGSGSFPMEFVIVEGGNELRAMNTGPLLGTFTLKRQ